jgi:dipeptidyl aminopeptidase/acylaminoacyl peptidase
VQKTLHSAKWIYSGSLRLTAVSILIFTIVLATDRTTSQGTQLPPLIPRAIILEDSERGNPELSPDAKMIAYCAPFHDVMNIWVRSVDKDDDRVVTHDTLSGISYGIWQADGDHLLYFQDQCGDENQHLFQTNISSGTTKDLTPFSGARAKGLRTEPGHPDTVLIHLNARDARLFDVYRLDLRTGHMELDTENPGDVSQFYADHTLVIKVAYVIRPDDSTEIRVRDDAHHPWRTLMAWGPDEMSSDNTGIVGFTADNTKIRVVTSLGANAERLLEVDLQSGAATILSEDPQFDVTDVMVNPLTHSLEAVACEKETMTWTFFDSVIREDVEALNTLGSGSIWIRSRDRMDKKWLVTFTASNRPTSYSLFDRKSRRAKFLFSEDPRLENVRLARKEPIHFVARDGLLVHGYLTLPNGVPPHDLPLVVYVHGGPWTRDRDVLDFPVQCLANRGYAVLQVNYRGSTGYGKAFQNAGNLEWGGKAIQDLVDGKNWVVARGIGDSERVAIAGGSYGGYAVLAAMAFHPGEFTCGIAINAMSDANLLLASMPAHWSVGRTKFETRMGKDSAFLRSISPVHRADQITAPLLIMHNANDIRVTLEHAERMVTALRRCGADVTYLVFPQAGHVSGGSHVNFLRRWAAIEDFLGRHLGGRVEPPGEMEQWKSLAR